MENENEGMREDGQFNNGYERKNENKWNEMIHKSNLSDGEDEREEKENEEEEEKRKKNPLLRLLGLFCLFLVVCIWVGSAVLSQYIYTNYEKPFFLTYMSTALFSIYSIGFLFRFNWYCGDEDWPRGFHFFRSCFGEESESGGKNYRNNLLEKVSCCKGLDEEKNMEKASLLAKRQLSEGNEDVQFPSASSLSPVMSNSNSSSSSRSRSSRRRRNNNNNINDDDVDGDGNVGGDLNVVEIITSEENMDKYHSKNGPASSFYIFKTALIFCPIWFCANYFYNISLAYTTVSSSTVISSTSAMLTLILSVIVKIDKFSWIKLFATLISFGGVILVTYSDAEKNTNGGGGGSSNDDLTTPGSTIIVDDMGNEEESDGANDGMDLFWLGDLLAFLSAMSYACYAVVLKKRFPDESKVSMTMFFGYVGLISIVLLVPVGIFLDLIGFEIFELPTLHDFILLMIFAFFGTVVSDFLWLKSVLLLSPLIATLGLALTIPLALLADLLRFSIFPSLFLVIGTICVFLGFFLGATEDVLHSFLEKRLGKKG